jgi:hypothetical protein
MNDFGAVAARRLSTQDNEVIDFALEYIKRVAARRRRVVAFTHLDPVVEKELKRRKFSVYKSGNQWIVRW